MDQLINDLLGLAQVGRQEMHFRPIQLMNLVERRRAGSRAGEYREKHRVDISANCQWWNAIRG